MESSFPVDAVQLESLLRREGCSAKEFAKRNGIGEKNLERALRGDRLLLCTINVIAEGFKKTHVTADMLILGDFPRPRLPPLRVRVKVEEADHQEIDVTDYSADLIGKILAKRPELNLSDIQVTAVRKGCMEIELAVTERTATAIRELFAAGQLKELGVTDVAALPMDETPGDVASVEKFSEGDLKWEKAKKLNLTHWTEHFPDFPFFVEVGFILMPTETGFRLLVRPFSNLESLGVESHVVLFDSHDLIEYRGFTNQGSFVCNLMHGNNWPTELTIRAKAMNWSISLSMFLSPPENAWP